MGDVVMCKRGNAVKRLKIKKINTILVLPLYLMTPSTEAKGLL